MDEEEEEVVVNQMEEFQKLKLIQLKTIMKKIKK
ncbi:MAG: hypothetical protein EZS28_037107, partial [Streblomastix strix]